MSDWTSIVIYDETNALITGFTYNAQTADRRTLTGETTTNNVIIYELTPESFPVVGYVTHKGKNIPFISNYEGQIIILTIKDEAETTHKSSTGRTALIVGLGLLGSLALGILGKWIAHSIITNKKK